MLYKLSIPTGDEAVKAKARLEAVAGEDAYHEDKPEAEKQGWRHQAVKKLFFLLVVIECCWPSSCWQSSCQS